MSAALPATTLDALRAVYRVLQKPEAFTIEAMALRADRRACDPEDSRAVIFDLHGAVWRVAQGNHRRAEVLRNELTRLLYTSAREAGATSITAFQLRGHQAVLDLIRSTAEKLTNTAPALELTPSQGVA